MAVADDLTGFVPDVAAPAGELKPPWIVKFLYSFGQVIESGDLIRQFRAAIRKQGWSARDLGDMYSLAYLTMWLVANDRDRLDDSIAAAAREDLREQLALDPKVSGAKDADQQELAEWLGSWTTVLAGSVNHLRSQGDPAAVEAFREEARRLIASPDLLGVDLTEVRLTRRGIVRG